MTASKPPPPRDLVWLLLTLTFVTGVVDAVSFLGLGRVFVANMTGNVVFLGFAAAGEASLSVVASVTAVLAFLLGALAGGRLISRVDDRGHRLLRDSTLVQTALVAVSVVLAATLGAGGRLGSELLIVVLGLAMGLQNAAVRRIDIPDLTTTVLTRTLTGLAADSKAAGGKGARPVRQLAAVAAMLLGAFAGGLLQLHVTMWVALLLALVVLLGVLGILVAHKETDQVT
ncbi:MAG TPA: YoaK family protein [Amycolatopsis sp.]